MDTRTLLLTLHIAAAGSWLGADLLVHALTPRLERDPSAAPTWARTQVWLHGSYYPIVAVVLLATGVLLVLDGGWSWSSDFIWVGVGAIILSAALGGGGLGSLSKRRVAALTAGDESTAIDASRKLHHRARRSGAGEWSRSRRYALRRRPRRRQVRSLATTSSGRDTDPAFGDRRPRGTTRM